MNEGVAEVKVCVAANGTVEDSTLVKSSGHKDLDNSAVALIRAGRFKARMKDGHAVTSCRLMRVTYRAGRTTEAPLH